MPIEKALAVSCWPSLQCQANANSGLELISWWTCPQRHPPSNGKPKLLFNLNILPLS